MDERLEVSLFWTCIFPSIGPFLRQLNSDLEMTVHTSNTSSRSNVHLNYRFLGDLISPRRLDRPVNRADDGIAVVCVCCRAICAIEMRECDFWGDHGGKWGLHVRLSFAVGDEMVNMRRWDSKSLGGAQALCRLRPERHAEVRPPSILAEVEPSLRKTITITITIRFTLHRSILQPS